MKPRLSPPVFLLDFPFIREYNYDIEPKKERNMKKIISFALALALAFSMVACGCDHTPGDPVVTAVDTEALTVTYDLPCSICGEVMETQESATGIAPVDSKMVLSPAEWYACLSTNILQLGASQTLMAYGTTESEDNAFIPAVVSMSGMTSAISFYDDQTAVLTTEQKDTRNLTHNICIEAQFSNETANAFYMFLMVVAMTNNSELDAESANTIAATIMGGQEVSDNGYTYGMSITSVEDHTVRVDIIAE